MTKPVPCPACGEPLGRPSMMTGCMVCTGCGLTWDGEWLARFEHTLAACRRALTMAEREMRLPSTFVRAVQLGSCDKARAEEQDALEKIVKAKAAIKAARTQMDAAQRGGRR